METKDLKAKELNNQETGNKEIKNINKVAEFLDKAKGDKKELTREQADQTVKETFGENKAQAEIPKDMNKGSDVSFGMGPCERKCANEKHETGYRY